MEETMVKDTTQMLSFRLTLERWEVFEALRKARPGVSKSYLLCEAIDLLAEKYSHLTGHLKDKPVFDFCDLHPIEEKPAKKAKAKATTPKKKPAPKKKATAKTSPA